MKAHSIWILLVLFIISSCVSDFSSTPLKPTEGIHPTPEPSPVWIAEPTIETKSEKVLLDFALSPDGKSLAVYLNTGVDFYDVETQKQETFLAT